MRKTKLAALIAVYILVGPILITSCRSGAEKKSPLATAQPHNDDWRRTFEEHLDRPVTFEFVDTPLDDVVAFYRAMMKVSIVVDRRAVEGRNPAVTLKVDQMPFRDALTQVYGKLGLAYTFENGAIFITTKERLAATKPFSDIPTKGWARTMFELKHGSTEQRRMAAALDDPVSFDFRAMSLGQVAEHVREHMKLKVVIDPSATDTSKGYVASVRINNLKLRTGLDVVLGCFGLEWTVRDDAIFIGTPEAVEAQGRANQALYDEAQRRLQAALDQRVSVDFIATPLADVAAYLSDKTKLDVTVDERLDERLTDLDVTLKLDDVTLEHVLYWTTRLLDLNCTVAHGGVLISEREHSDTPASQ